MVPVPAMLGLSAEQTDNFVALLRESAQFLLAVAAVIASIRSEKRARSAEASAAVAHQRATEAAREQLTFALKRAVLSHDFVVSADAKAQCVPLGASVDALHTSVDVLHASANTLHVPTPPGEGGSL